MDFLQDYITLDRLAVDCGVSVRTARRWCYGTSPGLPVTKLGKRPLVARDDLRAWLAARRVQKNPPTTRRGASK